MKRTAIASKSASFEFPFHSVRNISCPEDKDNNRNVLVGHAPITSLLNIPTDENVRSYLLDAEGRKRQRPTRVHNAIRDTLENYSDKFSVLNSGVVIVARDYEIDESKKLLRIQKPSIINGAQTQGVVRDFFEDCNRSEITPPVIHIRYELLVMDDVDLITETSIARNLQNDVSNISIVGHRGQLDELEKALQKHKPHLKLQKSETELSDDYLRTERLLQVITALTPPALWPHESERENPNKVYAYSQRAKCLREFESMYEKQGDSDSPEHQKYKALYEFYLDIVAEAQDLYNKWKAHKGFKGSGLHAIKRDEKGNILDVPDGIVFPILAALSAFTRKTGNGWAIDPPPTFHDDDLIRAAKAAYIHMATSNPNVMGKSRACYFHLYDTAATHKRIYEATKSN